MCSGTLRVGASRASRRGEFLLDLDRVDIRGVAGCEPRTSVKLCRRWLRAGMRGGLGEVVDMLEVGEDVIARKFWLFLAQTEVSFRRVT
jgi:hypothetical protein